MHISIPDAVKLELFETAFRRDGGLAVRTCHCGKRYYNAVDRIIDWEPGELEAMERDPRTTGVDHSICVLSFEGNVYVDACDCWQKRASVILGFIEGHIDSLAAYINARKKAVVVAAEKAPHVDMDTP